MFLEPAAKLLNEAAETNDKQDAQRLPSSSELPLFVPMITMTATSRGMES
jgi:hypothetical protein